MPFMYLHSDGKFKDRRKDLRNNATPQEIILWQHLRQRPLGYKFQRQFSVGPYIADFYCHQKKLVVEIDGSQHNESEAKLYDKDRTNYFAAEDIKVIRFWNNEVNTNIEEVMERIRQILEKK